MITKHVSDFYEARRLVAHVHKFRLCQKKRREKFAQYATDLEPQGFYTQSQRFIPRPQASLQVLRHWDFHAQYKIVYSMLYCAFRGHQLMIYLEIRCKDVWTPQTHTSTHAADIRFLCQQLPLFAFSTVRCFCTEQIAPLHILYSNTMPNVIDYL
jgi:hypothetical protein